jgi:hypothetical protein
MLTSWTFPELRFNEGKTILAFTPVGAKIALPDLI